MSLPHCIGQKAEDLALEFLVKRGLKLIKRNFRSKMGEIDLVMRDKNCLVFIEVRARKNRFFGHPFETVDYWKQQKIRKTAALFLQIHCQNNLPPCRFDIVSVTLNGSDQPIEWLQNAFQ